jgi:hypothetical protein
MCKRIIAAAAINCPYIGSIIIYFLFLRIDPIYKGQLMRELLFSVYQHPWCGCGNHGCWTENRSRSDVGAKRYIFHFLDQAWPYGHHFVAGEARAWSLRKENRSEAYLAWSWPNIHSYEWRACARMLGAKDQAYISSSISFSSQAKHNIIILACRKKK